MAEGGSASPALSLSRADGWVLLLTDGGMMATILIVEDQEDMRKLYQAILEPMGHDVLIASQGVEGLHGLKKHPDLVLLDLSMPTASGDVVLGFIRSTAELADVRVLVISAHPDAESIAEKLEADAFLQKPASVKEIMETVNRLLESPG